MAALAEYEIAKAEIDDAIETFCNRTPPTSPSERGQS
jgi:hypothetical protein